MRDSLGRSQVHRSLILFVATILSCGPAARPQEATVRPDSTQLIARAFAAYDSARGAHDTVTRTVRALVRQGSFVTVSLSPASSSIQGGGGDIRLDSLGRVVEVRLYQ